ncbi:30S ribosomal protein S2 [Candidatus Jorgensenbacteria bacterium RIFCSPLOWO2_01_FULL_45_25b]|uniref:Small ribosomal subunit protein uS2 n=1 Tax=Candidatus Jorgensenbacteria bacterium RIFCSPLOWO2_01_FULL_45_25b TaxID=1798471 RepID=A0A1F6BT45_9BACT|nr:MAG: 30S ribosomal protein S2 [Candidatus Jorgensenbacteria bacterium RIFCSPLOWO2_01_FULL_45_25b]
MVDEKMVSEMAQVGVIFGHKKSKTHPKMRPYIGANRNEIELLKPEAVFDKLQKAGAFLREKINNGGLVLMVGTLPTSQESVKNFAEAFKFPHVITRYLGGTLTNFKIMQKRLKYYQDLKNKKEKGELGKYTKKEQLQFAKELKKMESKFEGLTNLTRIPDALFIVDIASHDIALREAKRLKIPIVAIVDTNDNPHTVEYPIIGNDHAKASIDWIIGKMIELIKAEKKEVSAQ